MILANYHTHTNFCDGNNTPEEVVLSAIDGGLDILGFSGHAPTNFGCPYAVRDVVGYVKEILRLRDKYRGRIEILLGIEEDASSPFNRADFDYIIGSSHYTVRGGVHYPIDSNHEGFLKCIDAWGGDVLRFAEDYYSNFASYINRRKPDIVGHFDLLTKFDDVSDLSLVKIPEYNRIAERYMHEALKAECVFEVNTGAISRGYRKTPYPYENLLHIIKKEGGRVILTSDSHARDTLTCSFDESRALLREVGFKKLSVLTSNGFTEQSI